MEMKEKIITLLLCGIGICLVAYGMIWQENTVFLAGLPFVIGGYLFIRRKLKESLGKGSRTSKDEPEPDGHF